MPLICTENPVIERENAQGWMSTGRDTSRIASGLGRASDSALHSIRDPQKPEHVLALECRSCGARWSSVPELDGEFPQGFWRCPRGCDW